MLTRIDKYRQFVSKNIFFSIFENHIFMFYIFFCLLYFPYLLLLFDVNTRVVFFFEESRGSRDLKRLIPLLVFVSTLMGACIAGIPRGRRTKSLFFRASKIVKKANKRVADTDHDAGVTDHRGRYWLKMFRSGGRGKL